MLGLRGSRGAGGRGIPHHAAGSSPQTVLLGLASTQIRGSSMGRWITRAMQDMTVARRMKVMMMNMPVDLTISMATRGTGTPSDPGFRIGRRRTSPTGR
jgi:hypothetical protein